MRHILLFTLVIFLFLSGLANNTKPYNVYYEYNSKAEKYLKKGKPQDAKNVMLKAIKEFEADQSIYRVDSLGKFYSRYDKVKKRLYFSLCCSYALLNQADSAMIFLNKSYSYGSINNKRIKDKKLDNIRTHPDFELTEMRFTQDFIGLLKKYPSYNEALVNIQWEYQDVNDEVLKTLREKYNLDSIAGSGDEFSKQINLLNWVHKRVRHNGSSCPNINRDANTLIQFYKREKQGVNCRLMATILNEVYLAMGFKSHFVACMPENTNDTECHVINSVYSTQYKKWLWMDPSFASYVLDENNVPQSIAEVREKLISGEFVKYNDEMNWNGNTFSNKRKNKHLYSYMAKNLFWFSIPVNSKSGYESINKKMYINLYPQGYNPNSKVLEMKTDAKSGRNDLFTNNADKFWE